MELYLNKNTNKQSLNKDFYQTLEFDSTYNEISESNVSKIINSYQIFDNERNSCTKYRLCSNMNIIATNVLANPITEIFNNDVEITGTSRTNAINIINSGYTYNCGYDIFNNHNLRVNSFKTGDTLLDFTGVNLINILSIQDAIKNNLKEYSGWLHFLNTTKLNNIKMFSNKLPNEKIDLFPTRDYFTLYRKHNNKIIYNWDYILTYPYRSDDKHILVKDVNGINGIPIINYLTGNTNEIGNYLEITTPYKHGLDNGDIISFKYYGYSQKKTYQIYKIGDVNGLDKYYKFIIDIDKYHSDLNNNTFLNNVLNTRICKIINNVESKYYLRELRKLPNFKYETEDITSENLNEKIENNNIEILSENYQLGFSQNIYGDKINQIQFIDDIDINLLTDNLGRPLSEIFITVVKKGVSSDESVFGEITSGFDELPLSAGYANVRILNSNNNDEIPLETNITISGGTEKNIFYGDIVEYNITTVKENVIDDVYHRFNTIQRELSGNTFEYTEFVSNINENLVSDSLINTDSNAYGFGYKVISLEASKTYTLSANGNSANALNGKYLRFYIHTDDWSWQVNEAITSLVDATASITFTAPISTTYVINSYYYDSSEPRTGSVRVNWYKLEEGSTATPWTPSPYDSSDIVLVNNEIKLAPRDEGYYYKPHHKIMLKNYSQIIKQGDLVLVEPCDQEPFTHLITKNNEIILIDSFTGSTSDIKYITLKIPNINDFLDFDRVRISFLDGQLNQTGSTTTNIRIDDNIISSILIPYTEAVFGSINTINEKIYKFQKYYSESIPIYGEDNGDGKILWRDMLPEGVFDEESRFILEKQFTNNKLYLNRDINLYVRRQDPFGEYGLKTNTFPPDLYGNKTDDYLYNNRYSKPNEIC